MKFLVLVLWVVALACVFAAIGALPVWMLWNWLMPNIFSLPAVTLAQAFGLLLLSGFFFSSKRIEMEF